MKKTTDHGMNASSEGRKQMYDPLKAKAKVVGYSAIAFFMGLGIASGLGWTDASLAMPVIDTEPRLAPTEVAAAAELSNAFVRLADEVTPGVVRIEVSRPMPTMAQRTPQGGQRLPDFFRFFEPEGEAPPQTQERGEPPIQWGGGSGFIISDDGYILTNDHVVSGAQTVRVYLTDRRYFDARVVGTDPFTDVAVVKIDVAEALPTLALGNSDEVRVGEWVMAVGNPGFGAGTQLDYTVTSGIISARGRGLQLIRRELQREFGPNPQGPDLSGYAIEDFIQTDAVINPGNSGGPMVDLSGRVVGINSAIASATGYYQGYGFAIPINLARRVMEDLIEYGHVKRPRLGVTIEDVSPEDAEAFGLPSVSGVLIQTVPSDGPAAAAGIQQGDVVVAIDGQPIGYVGQLQATVAQHRPGERVDVTVIRNGERRTLTVRLDEAPINDLQARTEPEVRVAEQRIGIAVGPLNAERAREYGYEQPGGVVITDVVPGSPAARRTLGRGLKVVSINDRPVGSPEDVGATLEAIQPGEIVSFVVEDRTGGSRIVNVRMPGS